MQIILTQGIVISLFLCKLFFQQALRFVFTSILFNTENNGGNSQQQSNSDFRISYIGTAH
jgi:hypothetical protein